MFDLEWERNKDVDSRYPSEEPTPNLRENPFDFIESLDEQGLKAKGGFSRFQLFFLLTARAIHRLEGRLRIEVVAGDVTKVLEQIRYGLLGHRQATDAITKATDKNMTMRQHSSSPSEYPHVYDRIHLSNIPDYIGGTLSTFLYAMPVTIVGDDAYVRARCLRNPFNFRSMSHLNNEYLGISSESDLESVFQTRLGEHDGIEPAPLGSYANWHHSQKKSLPFPKLMPRARLEVWLYRMFLKIAIPVPRQIKDMELIYSPLNLTVLFRLVQHLSEAGYPSHWLSQVLANIMSGTITTNTRPPKSNPLKLREVKGESRNTCLTQSTGPFVAEMLTLASVWSSFLPFGLVGCQISSTQDVKKYEINFRHTKNGGQGIIACFVLVFVDDRIFKSIPASKRSNMRQLFLPDETIAQGAAEKRLHEKGMHVVSTWEWSKDSKNATFWMLSDIASEMRDHWSVRMIRTDDWSIASETVLLREGLVETGEGWSS